MTIDYQNQLSSLDVCKLFLSKCKLSKLEEDTKTKTEKNKFDMKCCN